MPPKQGSVTEADDPVLAVIASTSPNQSLLDDAVIDSISCDMSRKAFNTRLKALARISPKNAATIVEHILGEKTEQKIRATTAESKLKALIWLTTPEA